MNKHDAEVQKIINNAQEVSLNDLPKYSPWPSRMIGLSKWERGERTPKDVEREYEKEKYQPVLEIVSKNTNIRFPHDLPPVLTQGKEKCVYSVEGIFKLFSWKEAFFIDNAVTADCLKPYLPAPAIVDLGAGFGTTSLALASMPELATIPIYALEKMQSGQKIIDILAERTNTKVITGECDLFSDRLTTKKIPKGSIIIISSVLTVIHHPIEKIVKAILRYQPKIVLFFEPFYSNFNTDTLYGQLCAKYMEINKYNIVFDSELKKLNGDLINIVYEKKNYFGNNPFFPKTILAWQP